MLILSAATCAAVVPLRGNRVFGPFARLARMFKKNKPSESVAIPPSIDNDAGWKLIHSRNADEFEQWLGRDSEGLPLTPNEEPSLGSHVLIELFDCEAKSLELEESVGAAMLDAARASEATIVTDSFHEFKPYGVSGAVIIQESHYTIHTWPEYGFAAVDIFTCGAALRPDRAVAVLIERLRCGESKQWEVQRGVLARGAVASSDPSSP